MKLYPGVKLLIPSILLTGLSCNNDKRCNVIPFKEIPKKPNPNKYKS